MSTTRPRLLAIGEGLAPTGYARVMESLLPHLAGSFDVTLFAVNHRGAVPPRAFAVRASAVAGDPHGQEQLPQVLEEVRPALVLLHRDSRFAAIHMPALRAYRRAHPAARIVCYCPADWSVQPAAVPRSLAGVDLLVAYTRAGLANLTSAFASVGVQMPATAVIGHGVDSERFAPLAAGSEDRSRAAARLRLFGDDPALHSAFMVLNANRNQRRKRVELTLVAFALFARERPAARLYLHMGMRDRGCDVRRLAAELGIADRLLVTTSAGEQPAVGEQELNLIYNACEVGVNTAAAEGWGLVAFEHAATGAAQLVPGAGACAELWRDHGILIDVRAGRDGEQLVCPESLAAALARLHDDRALCASWCERSQRLATAPERRWPAIAARWQDALLELHERQPARAREPVKAASVPVPARSAEHDLVAHSALVGTERDDEQLELAQRAVAHGADLLGDETLRRGVEHQRERRSLSGGHGCD